ncbi:DUF1028 domain-containing protein, partial [Halorubrum sp. SP9]|uniref:DUF1028 domain-containing protein n=1 Tax=Halorubrum sp. SP9 TaxID=1537267 RepID=UPI0010F8E629
MTGNTISDTGRSDTGPDHTSPAERFAPGTFSIAAQDPETGAFGVAVSTALVGVGALCPFVSENAAVATQSYVNVSHGRNAVELADRGVSVSTACEALLADDPHDTYRQLHGVTAEDSFRYTGADCVDWAGDSAGDDYTVAGNMLDGADVIDAVSSGYADADGGFADRLIAALEAGQAAGGDKRGKISAALLIAGPEPKLYHNLRVDN